MKNSNTPCSLPSNFSNLWNENPNPIWLASVVLLHRNLEKFNFPGKLDQDRRKQIISLLSKELSSIDGKNPQLLKGEECSPLEKEFLVEHCLTNESYHQAHQGEGFILDDSGSYLISLNMKDHLHIYGLETKGEIETAWSHLVKIDTKLGKNLVYAYSPKFGFLTADSYVCGTGLVVTAYLQLSALIHTNQLEPVLARLKEEAIQAGSLKGDTSELVGDLLAVRNNYTLGINEETIISSLRNYVTKLIVEEKSARTLLHQRESSDIKDKIARAYGILIHSYQIEAKEALDEIALLKLGLELGWLKGTTINALNHLFFNCRRAHLLNHFPEKVVQEEVPHKRAEFIHKALNGVSLTI